MQRTALRAAADAGRHACEGGSTVVPKAGFIPNKLRPWIEARNRYRLSHAQVQMARELGLNPKKLGAMANRDQELWKMPLPRHIAHLYRRRFGRAVPDDVRSTERKVKEKRAQKELANRTKMVADEERKCGAS